MPETNMVYLRFTEETKITAEEIQSQLLEKDIRVGLVGENKLRLVTHYRISDEDIKNSIHAFREILK
jgi:threonine aldolase